MCARRAGRPVLLEPAFLPPRACAHSHVNDQKNSLWIVWTTCQPHVISNEPHVNRHVKASCGIAFVSTSFAYLPQRLVGTSKRAHCWTSGKHFTKILVLSLWQEHKEDGWQVCYAKGWHANVKFGIALKLCEPITDKGNWAALVFTKKTVRSIKCYDDGLEPEYAYAMRIFTFSRWFVYLYRGEVSPSRLEFRNWLVVFVKQWRRTISWFFFRN